jgi:hypothetical protein
MHTTRRKTGFIGFLVAINSIKGLFQDLVAGDQPPLKYLLTYKFSQDHLELFFGAVRSAGGCNNNPTVQQFTGIYKRLLMRSAIQGGKGNCQFDPTKILYSFDDTYKNSKNEISTISEVALIRKYDLLKDSQPMQADHDYADLPNTTGLTDYKKSAISYIGNFNLNLCIL